MEIRIITGSIAEAESEAVIAGLFEDEELAGEAAAIDAALGGVIARLKERGELTGKSGQQSVIHTLGKLPAGRVVVLGLGKKTDLTADILRGLVAGVCRALESMDIISAVIAVPTDVSLPPEELGQVITEGAVLGTYTFRRHLTKDAEHAPFAELKLAVSDASLTAPLEKGIETGLITSTAVNQARDMVNEPANFMNPTDMAAMATKIAGDSGLEIEILEREQMTELGMGGLLGVAQGTEQPPKFIIMKYNGGKPGDPDIALVGKAVTFDSGGISIKPSAGMQDMKDDMSGGAAVIAAMGAIGKLKPAINVVGLVPATENLPDGKALKPGDVITAMGGKTIEIISTDAEGRLGLADGVGYARKLNAARIVDIATLTGAMVVALGNFCSGAFTNNQELVDAVIAAGAKAGERFWQMPMYDDYKELNKSSVADIKNVGGSYGGAITAAHFVGEFAGEVPWVHLDIAGTCLTETTRNYTVKGGTGVAVRTLVNLVLSLAE